MKTTHRTITGTDSKKDCVVGSRAHAQSRFCYNTEGPSEDQTPLRFFGWTALMSVKKLADSPFVGYRARQAEITVVEGEGDLVEAYTKRRLLRDLSNSPPTSR